MSGLFDWLKKIAEEGLSFHSTEQKPLSGSGSKDGEGRPVAIYSHPVLGALGSFVEHVLTPGQEACEELQRLKSETPPDPRRHWAVLVGDVFHELSVDLALNVIYEHGRVDESTYKWEKFTVGWTKYDDVAIQQAGERAIKAMPPLYNIYDNNCQKFAIDLLNIICEPGREKVITSYSWLTQTKMGLPVPFHSSSSDAHHNEEVEASHREEAVQKAMAIMEEHTPRLRPEDIGTVGVHPEAGSGT